MKSTLIIFMIFLLYDALCEYKELPRHGSIEVGSNIYVYLDLSEFDVGDTISIQLGMDLFFADKRDTYSFQIDQVPATNYDDLSYWNKLRKVTNGNYTNSGYYYTFTWEEIKREGNNYIFIICPAPYFSFDSFKRKIIIRNTGLSNVAFTFLVISFFLAIIFIVVVGTLYYIKRTDPGTTNNNEDPFLNNKPTTPIAPTCENNANQQPAIQTPGSLQINYQ